MTLDSAKEFHAILPKHKLWLREHTHKMYIHFDMLQRQKNSHLQKPKQKKNKKQQLELGYFVSI